MSVPEECPDDGAEQPSKAGDRQTRDHGDRISNSGSVADGFQRAEVDPGPHPGHRGLLAEHPARLYLRNGDVVVAEGNHPEQQEQALADVSAWLTSPMDLPRNDFGIVILR